MISSLSLVVSLLASSVLASQAEFKHWNPSIGTQAPIHRCPDPYGEYSSEQERFLSALDGKNIVFIGDSITRYQYLELASFLTEGLCMNATDPGKHGYFLSHRPYASWQEFYTNSSDALNIQSALLNTRETCLCARIKLAPGFATEHRIFTYHDEMENLRPTDIVMNYGMWLSDTEKNCGRGKSGATGSCPSTTGLCSFMTKKPHPYRVTWMTTTPVSRNGAIYEPLGEKHHLNIPKFCGLHERQVLNRGAILNELEPDQKEREGLWWDPVHFHAQASHAFNGALIGKILAVEQQHEELKAKRKQGSMH